MTPQALAEASAAAIWADDRAAQHLGMRLDRVAPGEAVMSMTVTEAMLNGLGNGHGGYIFTLADSAFAFACNSHNAVTVAQQASINFTAPVRLGDRLTATAREQSRTGRSGVYDVDVTNQDGRIIAHFRGLARTIAGSHVPE
ncbi:hydroxyphenylacetyl-CoA thioesterase PaaI [Paracoccus sp. S-4012]|uniref:hydroxyphenylacetyl-CoA thioesterase PaaI n=1 Tax=Paracoccus sp. S-4012 TaxID=2665648 RepID=UPI0012B080AD|nr:hydroxyphenylacetyl-CoA thioesterase PaaI [Paracoccus sp. S-4012]MRX50541.1 hydroxyphenylacetyl-CoA thioesterase PaaI [Paracoccus sp. S-4012]